MNSFNPKAINKASLYLTQQLEKLTQLEQLTKKIKAQTPAPKQPVLISESKQKSANFFQKILHFFRP